jgi:hypothetical protein
MLPDSCLFRVRRIMVDAIVRAETMTWSKAHEIHEAWKKAGSLPCQHSFTDSLESDDAKDMGNYVCAVCGSYMPGLHRLSAVATQPSNN